MYIQINLNFLQITFPVDEKRLAESGGKIEKVAADDWNECRSDESNKSDYDYKYEEDQENMVVKKYKRAKPEGNTYGGGTSTAGAAMSNQSIKDPFIYAETVSYPEIEETEKGPTSNFTFTMEDFENVVPFGYPTEQFLRETKDDVYKCIADSKTQNRQNFIGMSKDQKENENLYHKEKDTGLLEELGHLKEFQPTFYWGFNAKMSSRIFVKITDTLYNTFRKLLRDGVNLVLRMHSLYPKPG